MTPGKRRRRTGKRQLPPADAVPDGGGQCSVIHKVHPAHIQTEESAAGKDEEKKNPQRERIHSKKYFSQLYCVIGTGPDREKERQKEKCHAGEMKIDQDTENFIRLADKKVDD